MAKVLGETGRFVTNQSIKKYQRQFLVIFLSFYFAALAIGYMLGRNVQPFSLILIVAFAGLLPFVLKKINRIVDNLERERLCFRKGAVGEAVIGRILDDFPDEFCVIHDLTTPFGNIDHVVIGPTGAYVIDAKNWKGVVAADGNGELLWNGKPTQKPEIKNISRRIMSIKEKTKVLASLDPYVQGVFAFPSAYVEAKWGTTGPVHCVKDEQLYNYIVENKMNNKLNKTEIESLSQAFLALAIMDKDFEPKSK